MKVTMNLVQSTRIAVSVARDEAAASLFRRTYSDINQAERAVTLTNKYLKLVIQAEPIYEAWRLQGYKDAA